MSYATTPDTCSCGMLIGSPTVAAARVQPSDAEAVFAGGTDWSALTR